ncbi:response regulator transcription factor [Gryllotalpicola daejeonensis]|uniref:Response regulator transcription factor n=1 Tax=Gryllotalpicola daejeonensis TaxID=993087 RepID=A0ABP7ZGF9_9MICO
MAPIRIALVNDYEVVGKGLAAMLRGYQDTFEIVELDAGTVPSTQVDLSLYDTFAAAAGDRDEVKALAHNPLAGRVVVYSWDLDEQLVARALANGAAGYVSKGLPARELVAALLAVHRGEGPVHAVPEGAPAATIGDWPGREEGLTQREAEILALITQGLSNAEIVERTHLSINSIKSYIRSCYRRIGVTNRSNAILWGVEHGFRPDHARHVPNTVSDRR